MSFSTETTPDVPTSSRPKSNIFIVEDEFITINTLQVMLQKDGYNVSGYAFSVAEALAMIEAQRPDMVLLDIYLQGEDNGISLARHLNNENIPFIFISAYANAALIEEAKSTRPQGYLVKPFREQDVLITLEIARYRHLNNQELAFEKEQNLLLRLGHEFSVVQTRKGLFETLHKELKTALPLEDMVITLKNEESLNSIWICWDNQLGASYEKLIKMSDVAVHPYLVWLSKLTEIAFINLKDWVGLFPNGTKIFRKAEKRNIDYIVIPLWQAGKSIGGLALLIRKLDSLQTLRKQFLMGIGDQIASALTHILARGEKIQRDKEDMLRTMLVQTLSEALDWDQKLLKAAKAIQQSIPFDFIVLGLTREKSIHPHCAFFRIGLEEYQDIRMTDLPQILGITAEQYGEFLHETDNQQAAIWQEAEFNEICKRYPIKGLIAKKFKVQSHLILPLPMALGGTFAIALYSRNSNIYLPEHLALLERLKPSLILTLDRLLPFGELEMLNQQFTKGHYPGLSSKNTEADFEGIIGRSAPLKRVFELTAQVAPVNTTVLLHGESGTGKELFTRALHQLSPRKKKSLIKVNCAAMPAALIESELFGHEKGAFTGAVEKRIGKFELADGGTIFLDEIGEMPIDLQVKLLRVLQEREIERIGAQSPIKIDVRVIAATNRDLKTEVVEGRFRLDLYYRLNVFPITLPPLRERREDIPLLANYFARKFSLNMSKPFKGFSETTINELVNYSWPGNIRELENIIERMVIMDNGQILMEEANPETEKNTTEQSGSYTLQEVKPKTLRDIEREYIYSILEQAGWRIRGKNGAAEMLNIKPTTLEYRIEKLGVKKMRDNQN